MIAYADGTPARVGDNVVVEGEHTGTVMHVLDSPEDLAAWGSKERGLMVDTSFGGLVLYAVRDLDGVTVAVVTQAK